MVTGNGTADGPSAAVRFVYLEGLPVVDQARLFLRTRAQSSLGTFTDPSLDGRGMIRIMGVIVVARRGHSGNLLRAQK